MRTLFSTVAGAGMLVAVALPTVPVLWPLAIGAALVTAGGCWAAWPWVVGRSGIDGCVARAVDVPRRAAAEADQDDDWRDDGSGDRPGWDAHHMRGLSPHNAWLAAPDDRGFTADSSATAEIPVAAPAAEEPTVVYDTGLFDLRLRRPKGRRRAVNAGARR